MGRVGDERVEGRDRERSVWVGEIVGERGGEGEREMRERGRERKGDERQGEMERGRERERDER